MASRPRVMPLRFLPVLLFLVQPAAARPGPVPDYAPLAIVRTHVQARDLSMEFVDRLRALAGTRHQVVGSEESPGTLVWLRDYQPVYIRDGADRLQSLRVRSRLAERNGHSFPGDPPAVEVPLVHENGNLVVAGRFVFISTRFF